MNVKFKKVLLGMAMMLGLTLLPISTQTVFAEGGSGIPVSGNGQASGQGTSQNTAGGPCKEKTGFYVCVTWADSDNGAPHAMGHGCILQAQNGYSVPAFAVDSQSRVPSSVGAYALAPWSQPAFVAGSSPIGFGEQIKSFLLQNNDMGELNAIDVAQKYCGVTAQEILQKQAENKVVFVSVQPIMWCNNWTSLSVSSKGGLIVGLTYGIGSQITNEKTWISNVTRGAFPKSFRYEKSWQGISDCNIADNTFSREMMMDKSIGCGIVSVKLNNTNQVVLCVEDDSGLWNTQYLSAGKTYTIQNPYQGAEFVEATFSTKKTDLTDPNASYDAVCGSGAPNRATGAGTVEFNIPNKEVALFVHYKGDIPDPELEDAHLYSWETSYVFGRYAADRSAGTDVDNAYTLETHINEVIEMVKGYTKSCPHNKDYTHANNASGSAVIDKITCRGSEDWQSQKYGVQADLGDFPNASWNLYRQSVSGEKWDTYSKALNNTNKWKIDEEVDPQFSYYLTRSHLEDVSACPEGGDAAAAINISPEYDWETSWTGKEGASQKADTEGSHHVSDYSYSFTAYGYDLKIYYHFECDGDYWEEGSYGDWDNDPSTADTYKVTDSETHPAGHKYNAAGSDWSGIGNSTIYKENSYTPDPWIGNTGDGHIEDKYKTKITPSGQNTSAGTVVAWEDGSNLSGNFAKGGSFDYTAKTGQLVGSQFQGVSFSIYPEVKMSVWTSTGGADKYATPQESVCYVMGEYARHYTPPIAHSYKARLTTGSMEGMGTLASAADGSDAKKVLDNASGHQDNDLGVTAMGTTFEIATTSRYKIDIYTVGCNVTDHEANSEWGNEKQSVKGSHEEYVSSILAGMQQEIIMKLEKGSGTSQSFDPVYYVLLSTESDTSRVDESAETNVNFAMGGYEEEGTVQGWCNTMWGGEAYTTALQYGTILDTMFISASGDDADNHSKPYSEGVHVGTALGSGVIGNGAHWYDEESHDKMKVEYYHTTVTFGLMNADDKMDWNLLKQNTKSRLKNATDSIHVTFYTRLFNDQDYTAADGYTWDGHTGTYRIDHLNGCDFHVVNGTNSQMKSN